MKSILHVLSFESKIVWRSHILKLLIAVVLGAGIYGIFFGKQEIDKQENRILEVEDYEKQQFDSLLNWVQLDTSIEKNESKYFRAASPTGYGRNKHFTYFISKDTPVAAGLCLGQRDLYPGYYSFNLTDLARQLNVAEMENPMKLLTGNFDLAYVIVFLCPLLIIGLFYDLYAKEKEGGTLPLLLSSNTSLASLLFSKGIFRLLIVWGAISFLVFIGFLINGVSLLDHFALFLKWIVISFLYTFLWSFLMSLVVYLRKSSALSAMIGFGLWIIFTLINPALINLFVLANEAVPDRTEMIHEVRNLNDKIWASPKSFVLDKFYKEYPSFNDGDTIDFDKWYYASFVTIDNEANLLNTKYEEEVFQRNERIKQWIWLAPAAFVHDKFSKLSQTNRQAHVEFVEEVHRFHSSLKEIYYQKIFNEELFTLSDLEALKK